MVEIILAAAAILVGFVALIWGSDKFVEGAATTARLLNMSALLIGLTIVALGTSAPEMLVSGLAALQDKTGLAVGNATGSNIANIAMILGITALITPIIIRSKLVWGELLAMLLATGLGAWFLLNDYALSRLEGIILLATIIPVTLWMFWLSIRNAKRNNNCNTKYPDDIVSEDDVAEINTEIGLGKALGILSIGLIVLLLGSQGVVWGATTIASSLGISEAIIGATIVAIGTSLPELGATLAAARKKEYGLAVGNVLGSNLYNMLAVLGIAGVVGPSSLLVSTEGLSPAIMAEGLNVQVGLVIGLSIFMALLLLRPNGKGGINRWQGGMLAILFAAFIAYSAITASQQLQNQRTSPALETTQSAATYTYLQPYFDDVVRRSSRPSPRSSQISTQNIHSYPSQNRLVTDTLTV